MTNIHKLFSRMLLAFALATSAGAVVAVPTTYHVDVDTRSLSGAGNIELTFLSLAGANSAIAVISNFTGDALGASVLDGSVSGDLSNTATFTSSNFSLLDQFVNFGGKFGFDVVFDFTTTGPGSRFEVSLYNPDFTDYPAGPHAVAFAELHPGEGVILSAQNGFASISAITAEVPEPGQWLLMATGLLLLGAMVRRRSR